MTTVDHPLERFDFDAAFAAREAQLAATLDMGSALTDHGTLVGSGSERGWYGVLNGFLPGRYGLATGKVIDSTGHQSEQIDLIIYDAFYSPLLFTLGEATFVPAESVYAVFEVKQRLDKPNLLAAAKKARSVRRLYRTSAPIPNQFGKAIRKDLDAFVILGGILASRASWTGTGTDPLEQHLTNLRALDAIDIGCALGYGSFDVEPRLQVDDDPTVLMSQPSKALSFFTTRLLHRLQQLGTVGAIDYSAYAEPIEQPTE